MIDDDVTRVPGFGMPKESEPELIDLPEPWTEPVPKEVIEQSLTPIDPDHCPECAAQGTTRGVSATVRRGDSILRRCRTGHTW